MHSLNPFLRAFFRSTLPAQCNPVNHHVSVSYRAAKGITKLTAYKILLVPTTETLLTSKDRETNTLYADLAGSEEFLASHVLRVPGIQGRGNVNVRDNRGKAKQFTTINGKTVVVKESYVYSNKGILIEALYQTGLGLTWL